MVNPATDITPAIDGDRIIRENKAQIAATQLTIDELNAQLLRKNLEFQVIQILSSEIATTLDLERIFELTMQSLDDCFGFKHSLVLLKENGADVLKVTASHGYCGEGSGALVAFGQGVIGVVAKRRKLMRAVGMQYKMVYARAVGQQMQLNTKAIQLPGLQDVKSQLAIPLVVKDDLIGVYAVESNEPNAFDALDEKILMIVGNQIGAAIANARAYREIEDLTEHLEERVVERTSAADQARSEAEASRHDMEQLAAVARRANQAVSLDEILRAVGEITEQRFAGDSLALFLVDSGNNHLLMASGRFQKRSVGPQDVSAEIRMIPLHQASGTLFRTFSKKRTFYTNKARAEGPATSPIDAEIVRQWDLRWILQIPLLVSEEVVAIISISGSKQSRLHKSEIVFCERLAGQVAGSVRALQNLDTVNSAKQVAVAERAIAELARSETEQARQETQSLNQLIKRLNENLDLKVITEKLHNYVKETYAIEYFALYGMDTLGENLTVMHVSFPEYTEKADREKFLKFRIPIRNVRGAHAFTMHAKRPWYLKKIKKEGITPEELFAIERLRMESFLMIPLILQGEPVGILDFWNDGQLSLTKDEISRLSILGEQLAGIIYGSKLFQQVQSEKARSDELLLNILPAPIAEELKATHQVVPQYFESVSVLFTDFVGFTKVSEKMSPAELVQELDGCFSQFDEVVRRNSMEKLKTIGDAYMCAAGIPERNPNHSVDACLTALEFCAFMTQMAEIKGAMKLDFWKIRIGVHSGPVTAGVIGTNKFAYDIWGDTVNTASRMESSGSPGKVNISAATYELVKDFFDCESRGEIEAKGKGKVGMYYLLRIKPGLSADDEGRIPNRKFLELRAGV